jgi:hypothetical protein
VAVVAAAVAAAVAHRPERWRWHTAPERRWSVGSGRARRRAGASRPRRHPGGAEHSHCAALGRRRQAHDQRARYLEAPAARRQEGRRLRRQAGDGRGRAVGEGQAQRGRTPPLPARPLRHLTLRSTFTDTGGRKATATRKIKLKRSVPKPPAPPTAPAPANPPAAGSPPASANVALGLYDCYSFSTAIGNTTYLGSVVLSAGGRYAQAAGRRGRDLINPQEGAYSASADRITFSSGPWVSLYGVPKAANKFDVWAQGEQVKSWTCTLIP